jgi:hypothetical protein
MINVVVENQTAAREVDICKASNFRAGKGFPSPARRLFPVGLLTDFWRIRLI